MLDKLQIKNYGANTKINIDFDPRVTTIAGKSFIGKSWILRALRWVTLNKPAGDSFIQWGADKAMIRILFDDDEKVIRKKGKGGNLYKRWTEKGYKVYTAFGNDVPPAIVKTLNMSPINFQGVNVLGQHEPPFWFCETAGEVSRQLNSIVNLEVIDSTLAAIADKIRTSSGEIKLIQKRLKLALEEKEDLKYAKKMNSDLLVVEGLQTLMDEKARKRSQIHELFKSGLIHVSTQKNALKQRQGAQIALSAGDIYREITISVESLSQTIKTAEGLQKLSKTKLPSLSPLTQSTNRVLDLCDKKSNLKTLIREAEQYKELICQKENTVVKMKAEIKAVTKGKCPLCGKSMSRK